MGKQKDEYVKRKLRMAEEASGAKDEEKKHFVELTPGAHRDSGEFEGGQCISKHVKKNKEGKLEKKHPGYVKNCSCSYRWQGKHSGNNNSGIYNKDRPELVAIIRNGTALDDVAQAPAKVKKEIVALKKTLYSNGVREQGIKVGRRSSNRNWLPQYYGRELNLPRENTKGDWYLNGPLKAGYQNVNRLNIYRDNKLKDKLKIERNKLEAKFGRSNQGTIPVGANFTKESWPYWNNHHHLIPAGILKDQTETIALEHRITKQTFFNWIAASPYNLHSKNNIQILPMDRSVGLLLSLPRHLRFHEKLINNKGKLITGYCNHSQYNYEVQLRLKLILTKAASSLSKGKKHPKAIKEKADIGKHLDRISRELSEQLLQLGGMANLPISADHLKLPTEAKYLSEILES